MNLTPRFCYWFSRPIVKAYTGTMLKMDVQKQAEFPRGAKIIAANHPTTTDPFFVASMVGQQSYILINELLFQVPLLGTYLHKSGHIPVCAGQGQEAIDTALGLLREGKTIIIFPEGALSPLEGGYQKARTGVARLAIASGAPVIPVGISLQRERIHSIKSTVRGKESIGRWYLRGLYHLTVGSPMQYHGDVEDRPYVRSVADAIMHHIIEMAYQSQMRMTPPAPLTSLPAIS